MKIAIGYARFTEGILRAQAPGPSTEMRLFRSYKQKQCNRDENDKSGDTEKGKILTLLYRGLP